MLSSSGIMISRIDVMRDGEAGVYIATSKQIEGLVIEADSLDGIKTEIQMALDDLLDVNYPQINAAEMEMFFMAVV